MSKITITFHHYFGCFEGSIRQSLVNVSKGTTLSEAVRQNEELQSEFNYEFIRTGFPLAPISHSFHTTKLHKKINKNCDFVVLLKPSVSHGEKRSFFNIFNGATTIPSDLPFCSTSGHLLYYLHCAYSNFHFSNNSVIILENEQGRTSLINMSFNIFPGLKNVHLFESFPTFEPLEPLESSHNKRSATVYFSSNQHDQLKPIWKTDLLPADKTLSEILKRFFGSDLVKNNPIISEFGSVAWQVQNKKRNVTALVPVSFQTLDQKPFAYLNPQKLQAPLPENTNIEIYVHSLRRCNNCYTDPAQFQNPCHLCERCAYGRFISCVDEHCGKLIEFSCLSCKNNYGCRDHMNWCPIDGCDHRICSICAQQKNFDTDHSELHPTFVESFKSFDSTKSKHKRESRENNQLVSTEPKVIIKICESENCNQIFPAYQVFTNKQRCPTCLNREPSTVVGCLIVKLFDLQQRLKEFNGSIDIHSFNSRKRRKLIMNQQTKCQKTESISEDLSKIELFIALGQNLLFHCAKCRSDEDLLKCQQCKFTSCQACKKNDNKIHFCGDPKLKPKHFSLTEYKNYEQLCSEFLSKF